MRVQPITTGYHPTFTDNSKRRLQNDIFSQQSELVTLSDLYKESDAIQAKIDQQNALLADVFKVLSLYIQNPTPSYFNNNVNPQIIKLRRSGDDAKGESGRFNY